MEGRTAHRALRARARGVRPDRARLLPLLPQPRNARDRCACSSKWPESSPRGTREAARALRRRHRDGRGRVVARVGARSWNGEGGRGERKDGRPPRPTEHHGRPLGGTGPSRASPTCCCRGMAGLTTRTCRSTRSARCCPTTATSTPTTATSAINRMVDDAAGGKAVFHRFYTEAQLEEQPSRQRTGLFFFRGKPGAPFAVICPGGGFSYVGSVHEGFPYAAEISRRGYNAFVLRYRAGRGGAVATEDLAAALSFIFANASSSASTPPATRSGAARPARGWPRRLVRTARRRSAVRDCRSRRRS